MPRQGRGHGRGPFMPLNCMYHGNDTNHWHKRLLDIPQI
jgi:hypothetical protein